MQQDPEATVQSPGWLARCISKQYHQIIPLSDYMLQRRIAFLNRYVSILLSPVW